MEVATIRMRTSTPDAVTRAEPLDCYRTFRLANASMASITLINQKRVTTCVSVHPTSWKW